MCSSLAFPNCPATVQHAQLVADRRVFAAVTKSQCNRAHAKDAVQGAVLAPSATTSGSVFGDGLRCAAGVTVRLGLRANANGASQIPSNGSTPLHTAGQIPATGAATRYYQAWYRDVNPAFCTVNRCNLTNGVCVVWVP